jgi:hypothetical protein
MSYASASTGTKLRIFIALSDAEDVETRRAASGALAILSSHPNICKLMMLEADRTLEIILGLVSDVLAVELCHRGCEILKNLCAAGERDARVVKAMEEMAKHPVDQVRGIAEEAVGLLKA